MLLIQLTDAHAASVAYPLQSTLAGQCISLFVVGFVDDARLYVCLVGILSTRRQIATGCTAFFLLCLGFCCCVLFGFLKERREKFFDYYSNCEIETHTILKG